MDVNRETQRAIDRGRENQRILELAQNWCAHLELQPWGGVGLVEQMTGLPIGIKKLRCPYARKRGIAGGGLRHVVLSFYDSNCKDCQDRLPVRIPNLLQLVEERESSAEERERDQLAAKRRRADALERRVSSRAKLLAGSDRTQQQLMDLIDRFDREPSSDNADTLMETAKAVKSRFSGSVEQALFELVEAGGWTRTDSGLRVLDSTSEDSRRVVDAALDALARGEALRSAGNIVASRLEVASRRDMSTVVPGLVSLASTTRGIGTRALPGHPRPLLRMYELHAGAVREGIGHLLASPDKRVRICACDAVKVILTKEPTFGLSIKGHLIQSLELPDDHYERGPASGAVANVFAESLRLRPDETDQALQDAITGSSAMAREHLFGAYTRLFRTHPLHQERRPTPADNLAVARIVNTLAQRPDDKRLNESVQFLRHHGRYDPKLLIEHVDVLIGAAALVAGDLDDPYSPLLDPRPDQEKALEARSREIHLDSALRAIAEALGHVGQIEPRGTGDKIIQSINGLDDSQERFRATLTESLGIIGKRKQGLAVVLPSLYAAMMTQSALVRAASAEAYGRVASVHRDDLPSLFHEAFLTLLMDTYVVVHDHAVRALWRTRLPDKYQPRIVLMLAILLQSYAKSRDRDYQLSDYIDVFLRQCSRLKEPPGWANDLVFQILREMEPETAARTLTRSAHQLRSGEGHLGLVARLLEEPQAVEFFGDQLIDELRLAAPSHVRAQASAIANVARSSAAHSSDIAECIVDMLAEAQAWDAAASVAQCVTEGIGETPWERSQKLRTREMLAAAELESAINGGQEDEIEKGIESWNQVQREMSADEQEDTTPW